MTDNQRADIIGTGFTGRVHAHPVGGPSHTVARGTPLPDGLPNRYDVLPAGHPQGYQGCFNSFAAATSTAIGGQPRPGLSGSAGGANAA